MQFAKTPIGPPEKNNGTKPGNTIMGLWISNKIPIEKMVPKVQKTKPNVAALGEKGNSAATSTAGMGDAANLLI